MTGFYIGVDGKARKVKGGYVGVDGVARKIKKGYIGVDGVARLCYQSGFDPVFANNNWEEIAVACQTNSVPDSWAVGDQKPMTIGGTDYLVDIIGKDHDDYTDGSGKAPLTFQLHDCYKTQYRMYSTINNMVGWDSCEIRTSTLKTLLSLMPTEISSRVREVNKLTVARYENDSIYTVADKLFLLSEMEVCGKTTYSKKGEGNQYSYYAAGNSKSKKVTNSSTSWWLRSPNISSSYTYCQITSSGGNTSSNADTISGVSFAFCF